MNNEAFGNSLSGSIISSFILRFPPPNQNMCLINGVN